MTFRVFSNSVFSKLPLGFLLGSHWICRSPWVVMDTVTILSLLIHEYGMSPFIYVFNLFQQYFVILSMQVFHLLKFIPKYFTLFSWDCNWDLHFLFWLFVAWVCWFCILKLHWIHLFWQFSCGIIIIFYLEGHLICKQRQFYFFRSNLDAFYFFPLSLSSQDI